LYAPGKCVRFSAYYEEWGAILPHDNKKNPPTGHIGGTPRPPPPPGPRAAPPGVVVRPRRGVRDRVGVRYPQEAGLTRV
ncbi:hypothetical protein, partial [Streptomyces sp. NPDC058955]|uniref:hypothetical protein n=1 Tax=Streptomyces sp. NPDC058955 TaxID=3346678 RepID=UPI0036781C85